ncbi:MAG: M55 family metallopeptidase [Candidatus Aminicenantaceae bacterium]
MKKKICILFVLILSFALFGYAQKGLKVFISVDMEGVCGVVHWEDVSRSGKDYGLFRRLMTEETNAAIEGALAAGATEILVRDSHGSARNILPDLLHPKADLLRDWANSPLSMMEGIDETFDAVIFIGYHARANTPDATLDHTMSSSAVYEVTLNGKKMPEAGINAFIAGNFGVPVALVAGDKAICQQVTELFGEVETVAVKEGIGNAAKMLHPKKAQELIKKKTTDALKRVSDFKPFTFTPPYTLDITFRDERRAEIASWLPGAKRKTSTTVSYTSNDWMDVLRFFMFAF